MTCRASNHGVDVVLESLDKDDSPHCPHGPTILFERYVDGSVKRFYACSACRDRKNCNFFQWASQPLSSEKLAERDKQMRELQRPPFSQAEYKKRLTEFRKLPKSDRAFCRQCAVLFFQAEMKDHQEHDYIVGISKNMLRYPTSLLEPLNNNRANAQYHFSDETLDFFLNTIKTLGFTKVLCIGVPRIHEEICARRVNNGSRIQSLLLDIDQRLEKFYSDSEFCRYNMFNHYFFSGEKSRLKYRKFLCAEEEKSSCHGNTIVVMDPPFGGMVEVLSHTVNRIQNDWQQENPEQSRYLPFFWIFPYFMESRITQSQPSFTMLDYKVNYNNHKVFTGNKKTNKHGSPVRIFTNLPPAKIVLPSPEYRFCEQCARYVSLENTHCDQCNACTSKDGRQYVHCVTCKRCVKPSWCHCSRCDTCHLPDYNCQSPNTGCHICGDLSHKRKQCPQKHSKKRKLHTQPSTTQAKKKLSADI